MEKCNLGFKKEDNPLAYKFYKHLVAVGVSCKELDQGEMILSYTPNKCPKAERQCLIGKGNRKISSGEILEYT